MLKDKITEFENISFEELKRITKRKQTLRNQGLSEEEIEQIIADEEQEQVENQDDEQEETPEK